MALDFWMVGLVLLLTVVSYLYVSALGKLP